MFRIFFLAFYVIFFLISNHLYSNVLKVEDYGMSKNYSSKCYGLKVIGFEDAGYVSLGFYVREFYSSTRTKSKCRDNPINYIKTVPEKSLRAVENITKNSVGGVFVLVVNPSITKLIINGVDQVGKTDTITYNLINYIKELKNIQDNKNWLDAMNSSEEKLAEKKNSDKTAPQINLFNIQNNQKTDSYNFFIRGKVSDEEGVLTVLVNDKKSNVKSDGTFAARVKLGYGLNKIKVQAEDINGNVSEKIVNLIREEYISETTLSDVDLPIKTNMKNDEGLAVVIGVENYQYVPNASYAYNDAEVFKEYIHNTLGYKKQRIKLSTNSKATLAELNKLLGPNGWLARNIVKDTSDIIVYFSGHGIANQKENTSGLLPYDVDPNYSNGILLKKLYKDLASMGAKSITVFLDACYTGQTRNEEMLILDSRPITVVPIEKDVPSNVTVLSAASGSQISGALKEKEHGLFTYYLLKGMSGKADDNKDNNLDITELSKYVIKKVKEQAALSGREQTPQIIGDNSKLLIQY